jgi:hypothetical protein
MAAKSVDAGSQYDSVEVAKYLWEEYKYRHDLIWRLMFRVTGVAVLLSVIPFTIDDLATEEAGVWVKFLPALAIALVLASWPLLWAEFRLFRPIDKEYVEAQQAAVGKSLRERRKIDSFKWIVLFGPLVMVILTTIVGCIVWF